MFKIRFANFAHVGHHQVAWDGLVTNSAISSCPVCGHYRRRAELEPTGDPVDAFGGEVSIVADKELIKDRVFGAFNFLYDPEVTHSRQTGRIQREATPEFLGSITRQLQPGLFVRAETRYLRKCEGLDLDPFIGGALFVGPTMFVRLSKTLPLPDRGICRS